MLPRIRQSSFLRPSRRASRDGGVPRRNPLQSSCRRAMRGVGRTAEDGRVVRRLASHLPLTLEIPIYEVAGTLGDTQRDPAPQRAQSVLNAALCLECAVARRFGGRGWIFVAVERSLFGSPLSLEFSEPDVRCCDFPKVVPAKAFCA